MIFGLKDKITLWEAVATVELYQGLAKEDLWCSPFNLGDQLHLGDLFLAAGIPLTTSDVQRYLTYNDAFRQIEDEQSLSYQELLDKTNGLRTQKISPIEINNYALGRHTIAVCPFGIKPELNLPATLWKAIIKLLRTYDLPVQLIGGQEQRMDVASFLENDILCNLPFHRKLTSLARCRLIVGVPNEYTWVAAGMGKPMLYFYPENIPQRRWFMHGNSNFRRVVYDPNNLQIPVVLKYVKELLSDL